MTRWRSIHRPGLRLCGGVLRHPGARCARAQPPGRESTCLLSPRHRPVDEAPRVRRCPELRAEVHAAPGWRAAGTLPSDDIWNRTIYGTEYQTWYSVI